MKYLLSPQNICSLCFFPPNISMDTHFMSFAALFIVFMCVCIPGRQQHRWAVHWAASVWVWLWVSFSFRGCPPFLLIGQQKIGGGVALPEVLKVLLLPANHCYQGVTVQIRAEGEPATKIKRLRIKYNYRSANFSSLFNQNRKHTPKHTDIHITDFIRYRCDSVSFIY